MLLLYLLSLAVVLVLDVRITCPVDLFHDHRPLVDHGALSNCERPRDGVVCQPTCERGYTDIRSIECQLIGSTSVKTVGGKEFHPHKWIVKKPGIV